MEKVCTKYAQSQIDNYKNPQKSNFKPTRQKCIKIYKKSGTL